MFDMPNNSFIKKKSHQSLHYSYDPILLKIKWLILYQLHIAIE